MSRSRPPSRDIYALLEHERALPHVPASHRARALARARAALAAGVVAPRRLVPAAPRGRWGLALAAAGIASAAVGIPAYEIGRSRGPASSDRPAAAAEVATPPSAELPSTPPPVIVPSSLEPAPAAAPPSSGVSPSREPRSTLATPGPDELRLLREARAAVARHDFATALEPVREHARRFKSGRLVEEREALRVKALSGLGRTEEARRAAEAFKARFPRSVLLPAVSQMPAGEQ